MDGKHLVITCTLSIGDKSIPITALIDCGATGYAFVDENFVRHHQLPLTTLRTPRPLTVIDGREISSGDITHMSEAALLIDEHHERLPMFVTTLGSYSLVLGIPWLRQHDVTIRFASNLVTLGSQYCLAHCTEHPVTVFGVTQEPPEPIYDTTPPTPETPHPESPTPSAPINISLIGAVPFARAARRQRLQIYSISVKEIDKALSRNEEYTDLRTLVPADYHDYLDLFSEAIGSQLPPHRKYDHTIPLKPGFEPPFGPIYSLSRNELIALKEWLDENLSKGFIRASSSSAGAPILFVKKGDGSLRLCVDYRGLNEGTLKNRYPLPLLRETLMRLQKAKWFTTLDVRGAYNLIRMAEGEEWKTAFRTRYGLFESLVMPFGLTNAPADFQHFINDVLRPFLDVFCTAYLDDILVYSESLEQHKQHVRMILEALTKAGLHLKPEKCHFHKKQVKYLGFIITTEGVTVDPAKIATIMEWPAPENVKDVRSFLGFACFYRRFVQGYSQIVAPMTNLTRKDTPFVWSADCQQAFATLKSAFTSAPILRHFDFEKEIIVETDASDYVSAGVLSQKDDEGVLHPVAFYSKKHSPAECNYEIYDKELMAIIRAFEEWRPELEGAKHPIQVLSDHRNLEYFMSTKLLNRRQTRWAEFLSRFNFNIVYRPGKAGGKPDALTRRSGDLPKEGDQRLAELQRAVLKPQNLPEQPLHLMADTPPVPGRITLTQLFKDGYEADPFPRQVIKMLADGTRQCKQISLADCTVASDRLFYKECAYVPEFDPLRLRLLQTHHDAPPAGHPGRAKTFELLSRSYYWPSMRKDTERYVANCHTCRRTKATHHVMHGVLRPLPVPTHPWQHISMDFVTGLPVCDGFDAIWVVVDRLTKQRHLVPCHTTVNAEDLADLFLKNVFRLHGLPDSIISDRGPQFASRFWHHLTACLKTEPRLSTAFHPETDGQTERINAIMEQYLRGYVNYQQDDWVRYLHLAEFAANNQVSDTLGISPFFANLGFHPRCSFELDVRQDNPEEIDAQRFATHLSEIHDVVRSEMRFAQARYQENADRHRVAAPAFQPGDQVWLNAKNIRTSRPSRKLDNKRLGPFTVDTAVGTHAYRLLLPDTMKVHPVFHVSLLDPARDDPLPGQQIPPPPPVIVDGEKEHEVEEILDSRVRRRRLQYLVKWTGYDDPTWEPQEYLEDVHAVDVFHAQYPDKPHPPPRQ